MFPLRDDNPTRYWALMTVAVMAANVAVWVVVQGMGANPAMAQSVCRLALFPAELLQRVPAGTRVALGEGATCVLGMGTTPLLTPLTSMFMHGSWFHIVSNMWFLWVFGNNVEDAMGRSRFVLFYVLSGLGAAAAQVAANPASTVPMIGASGAIGGVMGAYAVLYPRAHVQALLILGVFIRIVRVPAIVMLVYWFAIQLLGGSLSLGREGGGVAFWAHIGGFVAGAVLVWPFRRRQT